MIRTAKYAVEIVAATVTLVSLCVQFFAYIKIAAVLLVSALPIQNICVAVICAAVGVVTFLIARALLWFIAHCLRGMVQAMRPYLRLVTLVVRTRLIWRKVGYRFCRKGGVLYDHSCLTLEDYHCSCSRHEDRGPTWLRRANWELQNALAAA